MNPHTLTVLEFEKVRRMMLRWAFSSLGKERIEALHPSLSMEEVRLSLARISEWKSLELRGEAPSPDPIEDLARPTIPKKMAPGEEAEPLGGRPGWSSSASIAAARCHPPGRTWWR